MKQLLSKIAIIALAVTSAFCQKAETLPPGSFSIVSGIDNNRLEVEGYTGATKRFYITSKYAWSIAPIKGLTFSPSSGEAGANIAVTAIAEQNNNSLNEASLGNVVFVVEKTRFVGVTAYQSSLIKFENGTPSKINLDALAESSIELNFSHPTYYMGKVELAAKGDIEISLASPSQGKYNVQITTLTDNYSAKERKVGEVEFKIDGPLANSTIEVWQHASLRTNKESLLLGGAANSKAIFTVTSPFAYSVSTTSESFTATMLDNGNVEVEVTEENTTKLQRHLGSVIVALTDDPTHFIEVEVEQRPAYSSKCIMFYFLGTGLKSYFEQNIKAAISGLTPDMMANARIVYFLQDTNYSGVFYEIVYDSATKKFRSEEWSRTGLPTIYTTEMMAANIENMASHAPALEYGLIVGSHGKGWVPKQGANSASVLASDRYHKIWQPVPGAVEVRHIGDKEATQLNTDEVAEAIASSEVNFEYMILDVCYMSNIESLYDLRHAAKYILASPVEVLAKGMPYEVVMPRLLTSTNTPATLDGVASDYIESYKASYSGALVSACSAVTVCSELESLAESVKAVNNALNSKADHNTIQHYDGISSNSNPTHIFYDLEDWALQCCSNEAAVNAFVEQLNRTVLSRHHTDTFYSVYNGKANAINHYSGVSTSAPIMLDPSSAYVEEWQQTAWYKATH